MANEYISKEMILNFFTRFETILDAEYELLAELVDKLYLMKTSFDIMYSMGKKYLENPDSETMSYFMNEMRMCKDHIHLIETHARDTNTQYRKAQKLTNEIEKEASKLTLDDRRLIQVIIDMEEDINKFLTALTHDFSVKQYENLTFLTPHTDLRGSPAQKNLQFWYQNNLKSLAEGQNLMAKAKNDLLETKKFIAEKRELIQHR